MKTSRIFTLGAVALALLLGLILTGCPAEPGETSKPTKVSLGAGSPAGATADSEKITGLTASKEYAVNAGGKWFAVKDDGTLDDEQDSPVAVTGAALSGTEITGLTNGVTYTVYEIQATTAVKHNTIANAPADSDTGYVISAADANVETGTKVIFITKEAVSDDYDAAGVTDGKVVTTSSKEYTTGSSSNVTTETMSAKSGDSFITFTGLAADFTVTLTQANQ